MCVCVRAAFQRDLPEPQRGGDVPLCLLWLSSLQVSDPPATPAQERTIMRRENV